ncbi:MAG: DPP IV N-terminal domain-containing protein [Rikenellaceae bacterium]
MKKILLLAVGLVLSMSIYAQNEPITKSNYELPARFTPEKLKNMVYTTKIEPTFLKNGKDFWYSYKTSKGEQWYFVDGERGVKSELFNTTTMAAELSEITFDPYDALHIPIRNIHFAEDGATFTFEVESTQDMTKEERAQYEKNRQISEKEDEKKAKKDSPMKKVFYFEYNRNSGKITELKDYIKPLTKPSWASISPDGETVIFARNNNLYWMDSDNYAKAQKNEKDSTVVEHQITKDGTADFSWGGVPYSQTNVEAKENEGKRGSVYAIWSPDSKHFLIQRSDDSAVDDLWVINNTAEGRPTLETYKYHMAGEANASVEYLYLFDTATKAYKEVDIAQYKDQSISVNTKKRELADRADITPKATEWLGDNDKFYMGRTSRDMKNIDLCVIDITSSTPKAEPVIKEKMNTSIESRPIELINSGKEIISWSEKSGWGHLYLYDAITGDLKRQITSGDYHVDRITDYDEATRTVYFTAHGYDKEDNPYYTHLYKVNVDGGVVSQLTASGFDNSIILSDNCKFFINNYSRVDTTPQSALYSNLGRELNMLETADLSTLFAAGYKFPEQFTVKASDGVTDLYGVMYKPFDFDSTKLYPIIEYVYPGPQTEAVNTQFTTSMDRIDRLAQFGFVVVTVGNLGGHPNRSKWYHNYGYGNLRDYGLADKKTTVEQLAARHDFIDINRVGIHGHSGGGFMSTAAMLVYPDFFKVAVSCAGNHQNNIYNRWWSEKHHGIQEVVNEADTSFIYDIKKNADIAKNLKGKLLLIHGDIDNNVHPANTMTVVKALIKANKRFDMLLLPGQRHAFGDMTEYFFWKMGDYFSRHLIGDEETTVDIPQMQGPKTN